MGDPSEGEYRFDGGDSVGAFFTVTPDPVIRYSIDGDRLPVRAVNPAHMEVLDGTDSPGADAGLAATLADVIAPDDPVLDDIIDHAAEPDAYATTVTCDVAGADRRFLLRVVPEGPDAGFVVCTDVTTQEQRREQLERRNERLEEFASVVAHDLRNPLEIARMWLEPARETGELSHLDKVAAAHDRIERTIDDLLALARQGEIIEETQPVAIEEVVSAAWSMVDTGDADLVVEDGLAEVAADPDRLQRLFENVFRNAIEHAGDGITVTVGPTPEGTGFYVADDGVGIPPDERDRVFEAGYSTTDGGTGLGLAIVERIAEAHGWDTDVASSETGGVKLVFTGV